MRTPEQSAGSAEPGTAHELPRKESADVLQDEESDGTSEPSDDEIDRQPEATPEEEQAARNRLMAMFHRHIITLDTPVDPHVHSECEAPAHPSPSIDA